MYPILIALLLFFGLGNCDVCSDYITLPPLTRYLCEKEESIGQGGFGKVFLINDNIFRMRYALKIQIFDKDNHSSKVYAQLEARIGTSFKDMGVTAYRTTFIIKIDDGRIMVGLVTDYYYGGTFRDYLIKTQKLTYDDMLEFILIIFRGALYLKENELVHLDIKSENIMMGELDILNPFTCKMNSGLGPVFIDFGFVHFEGSEVCGFLGTLPYAPIEMIRNGNEPPKCIKANNKMDIYSLGMVLYNIISDCQMPFRGSDQDEIVTSIFRHKYTMNLRAMFGICFLITNMIFADPNGRMDLEKLTWYTLALIRLPDKLKKITFMDGKKMAYYGINDKITEDDFKEVYGFNYYSDEKLINSILKPKLDCHTVEQWKPTGNKIRRPQGYVHGASTATILGYQKEARQLEEVESKTPVILFEQHNQIKEQASLI